MEFRILGPLEVIEGDRVVALGTGRARSLLALLLLHANEVVSTERLIEELWGDAAPATATKSVQVYVSRLRKNLHNELAADGHGVLLTRAGGYVLEVDASQFDLRSFEQALEAGRRALAGDEPDRAAERLRDGLALWRGPPLADFTYEPFAQRAIARLAELHVAALEERIEADLALGRQAAVVEELETLVEEHPLRERLRGQLMLTLYRCERQVEALDVYRRGRVQLVQELGIEPSPTLQRLEQAILAQSPELAPPQRPGPPARRLAPPTAGPPAPPPPARRPAGGRAVPRRTALLAAGALLLAAACAAAVLQLRTSGGSGGDGTIVGPVSFSAAAAVDPRDGSIDAVVPLPGRLGRLAIGRNAAWVGSDDAGTVSAIDARTRRVTRTVVVGGFPSDVAIGAGSVWVLDGHAGSLARIDPGYGRVVDRLALPPAADGGRSSADRFTSDPTSIAAGAGGVWVTDGSSRLLRVDPATTRLTAPVRTDQRLGAVAVGGGAVWAVSGPGAAVLRIDPVAGRVTDTIPIVSRPGAESPYPVAVAADDRSVWVLSANTATLTRIDARSRGVSDTTAIGVDRDPGQVATGAGAAWVANGDGTLWRVDATTGETRSITVGRGLRDVGVGPGGVWVTNQLTRCCGQE